MVRPEIQAEDEASGNIALAKSAYKMSLDWIALVFDTWAHLNRKHEDTSFFHFENFRFGHYF